MCIYTSTTIGSPLPASTLPHYQLNSETKLSGPPKRRHDPVPALRTPHCAAIGQRRANTSV